VILGGARHVPSNRQLAATLRLRRRLAGRSTRRGQCRFALSRVAQPSLARLPTSRPDQLARLPNVSAAA
jgi:hypothetical protein